MQTLEKKLELVPVRPARKAFDIVRWYFQDDGALAASITASLNELYPEKPILFNTVVSSFRDSRQLKIQTRISDLVLDWETQLKYFLDGKKEDAGLANDSNFLGFKRNEGIRISQEIRHKTKPLMDSYQFVSRKKLVEYLSLECSTQKHPLSYSMINSIFSGHDNQVLTPQMVKLYGFMSDMLQRAEQGSLLEVPSRYVIIRRETNNPEPLRDFIGRVLEVLLGKKAHEDRRFVEKSLEKLRSVNQIMDLKRSLRVSYGFSSNNTIDKFFAELLDLEGSKGARYLSKNAIGTGAPMNTHRKLYAAAIILDDAKKRGVAINIKPDYLSVVKNVYMADMNSIRRKGIDEVILEEALISTLGISRNTARLYISGKKAMPKTQHLKLRAFIENDLGYMSVFDLSDKGRKAEELERLKCYAGGRVLIKTAKELSQEDVKPLQEFCERVYRIGFPFLFLFPFPRKLPEELSGYIHYSRMFKQPDNVKIASAFTSQRLYDPASAPL